jgi:ribonuclease-3
MSGGEQRAEMTVDDLERVARLVALAGAPLADRWTALAALTHKSYVNEHRDEGWEENERLEFLGDAVVDLVVSEYLMSRFPLVREGDLSKLRAAVVDEAGLAAMGRALGLGELLRLGRGEELTGGREKASLLADTMEAVIAAVFLDGGLAAAHALVDRFLDDAYAGAETGTLDRDWKTQLQEQGQARHRSSPRYRVVAEVGPEHAKIFEVEVELGGLVLGRGSGRSKKDAEQAAARVALDALAARSDGLVGLDPPKDGSPLSRKIADPRAPD